MKEAESPVPAENLPQPYTTIIALGKGWDKTSQSGTPLLSLGSLLTAEAAAVLLQQNVTKSVLLTGGKTAGAAFPSEAEAMRDYIRSSHAEIPDSAFLLETESLDTAGNAEKSRIILTENGIHDNIAVLSDELHEPRAKIVFSHYGINAATETVESALLSHSDNFRGAIAPYRRLTHSFPEQLKERTLRQIARRNPSGSWLRKITSITRR